MVKKLFQKSGYFINIFRKMSVALTNYAGKIHMESISSAVKYTW